MLSLSGITPLVAVEAACTKFLNLVNNSGLTLSKDHVPFSSFCKRSINGVASGIKEILRILLVFSSYPQLFNIVNSNIRSIAESGASKNTYNESEFKILFQLVLCKKRAFEAIKSFVPV